MTTIAPPETITDAIAKAKAELHELQAKAKKLRKEERDESRRDAESALKQILEAAGASALARLQSMGKPPVRFALYYEREKGYRVTFLLRQSEKKAK